MDAGPSLQEVFASVPDPRSPLGRRHSLEAILSLTVVALLAGMRSLEAIAQFGRDHGPALAEALGFTRHRTPCKSTLSLVFRDLDIVTYEAALARWARGRRDRGWEAIALDGKTLRGSTGEQVAGVHLVAAFAPAAGAVLGQIRVDSKTNEHKAALQLLGVLPLQGVVVTGDAMFTQRDLCQGVLDGGGDYLLPVKDNQPTLRAEVEAAFAVPDGLPPPTASVAPGKLRRGHPGRQGARPA